MPILYSWPVRCFKVALTGLLLLASCTPQSPFPHPFFGEIPDTTPVRLGPGTISLENRTEMGCAFSPDATEFWFVGAVATAGGEEPALFRSQFRQGGWTNPRQAPFDPEVREFSPHITPDGRRFLFFRQKRSDPEFREGTWVAERIDDTWAEPQFFHTGYCLVQDLAGSFYFNSDSRETTNRDLVMTQLHDGQFTAPTDLPGDVNSLYWEAHPCIDPGGRFILFDSIRPDSLGGQAMYVSFRRPDGSWGPGIPVGDELRFEWGGNTPALSPDGEFLLFHADGDLWWVSIEVINRHRP